MGFFDDLKKGLKDVSEAAKNTVEEAKAREAQRANAGTLKPDAAPQPQTQAKAPLRTAMSARELIQVHA